MNLPCPLRTLLPALALTLVPLFAIQASPGAHGPNGEHLDAPSQVATLGSRPRTEAATEAFELVATLYDDELSILIDRFATNEPVLGGKLTVESGGLKAEARFHADHGDYAVDDAQLLAKLRQPGEHTLVFTLIAGEDSDLIDALLRVTEAAHDDDHAHAPWARIAALGTGAALLLGTGVWAWRRRRAHATFNPGAL
jgi:hypothetical protein